MKTSHPSSAVRGTFSLAYAGSFTDSLPHDISEEAMELALEALPSLRDVQVTRSDNASFGYEWSVTFFTESPTVANQRLHIDSRGLVAGNDVGGHDGYSSTLAANVGYSLTAGLPGWSGAVTLQVSRGSAVVKVVSGGGFDSPTATEKAIRQKLRPGLFVRIVASPSGRSHVHEIVAVNDANNTLTLNVAYDGASETATAAPCDFGTTVPGSLPRDLMSATVASFDTSRVGGASYTITG